MIADFILHFTLWILMLSFSFFQWFTHRKLAFHPEERLSCCFQYEAAGKQ